MGAKQLRSARAVDDDHPRDPHRLQVPSDHDRQNSFSAGQQFGPEKLSVVVPQLQRDLRDLSTSQSVSTSRKTNSHDRVLAYLVIAVIICWTPNHVYFTLHRINGFWNPMYYAFQYCVFYANSWINPMICFFALPTFRVAIKKLFHCHNI